MSVSETEPLPGAPELPAEVERPFEVRQGTIGEELKLTIENAKRDGVEISERAHGSQRAGSIETTGSGGYPVLWRKRHRIGLLTFTEREAAHLVAARDSSPDK